MLYPTEPNMLIKAWDSGVGDGIFQRDEIIADLRDKPGSVYGVGHAEGRSLRNRLMKTYGSDFSMLYVPDAGVTTSPVPENPQRGLTVTPEGVAGGAHQVDAILHQSQSYASAETLAREFAKANPALARADQNTLRDFIFRHFEEIARLMVDNPELTRDSQEIRQRLTTLRESVAGLSAARGRARPGQSLKDAANAAHNLMEHIITVITANEFKDLWHRLRTLLDEIARDRRPNDGAPQ
jgi:hypothetical protein